MLTCCDLTLKTQPVDGKKILCCPSSFFALRWSLLFYFICDTKYRHKKELFITKTGEAYNTTETTRSVLQNMTYIMHVWGRSVGMDCVNMRFAWSVMTRTNQSGWEVPKTRMYAIQILKSTKSVSTGYLILMWQVILGGVANQFVTLKFGKVGYLVALAVRGSS